MKKLLAILTKKGRGNIFSYILKCKTIYIAFFVIILIQFALVSIIFLQNKKSKYLMERTSFMSAAIENQQNLINKKLDTLQSNLSRLQVQLYRINSQQSSQPEASE